MKRTLLIFLLALLLFACKKPNHIDSIDEITVDYNVVTTDSFPIYEVSFNQLPDNLTEIANLYTQYGSNPYVVAAIWVANLNTTQANFQEGLQSYTLLCHSSVLRNDNGTYSYEGKSLLYNDQDLIENQLNNYPLLYHAYYDGGSAANGYTPSVPYKLKFTINALSGTEAEGQVKYYLVSEASDSPRPITVKTDNGAWKVLNFSSILLGYKQ